jgi:hypothetical protein
MPFRPEKPSLATISHHVLLHHLLYAHVETHFFASDATGRVSAGYSRQDGTGSGTGPGYGATYVYAYGDGSAHGTQDGNGSGSGIYS